jgi:phage-related baseplate assembly protein
MTEHHLEADIARPRKRSESLALDNMRNIVNQARAERNDAVALAQDRRMLLDQAAALLKRSRDLAKAADPSLASEIGGFLGALHNA